MGVLDMVRGRDNTAAVSDLAGTEDHRPKNSSPEENLDTSGSDSDRKSLEARNEKEIELHPGQITEGAQLGIQRAEAAALVWSKKALIITYAW